MHNDDPSRLCFLLESAEAAAYRAQPKRAAWLLPIIRRLSSTAARLAERMDLANQPDPIQPDPIGFRHPTPAARWAVFLCPCTTGSVWNPCTYQMRR
jgi:hypothetical protein